MRHRWVVTELPKPLGGRRFYECPRSCATSARVKSMSDVPLVSCTGWWRPRSSPTAPTSGPRAAQVADIRRAHAQKEGGYIKLGRRFGMSSTAIAHIIRRETWAREH